MIRNTSIEAYKDIIEMLGLRQLAVFHCFRKYGDHTNLEVSKILGIPINQITPRTNELVKKGALKPKGTKQCDISGRSAIVWGIA